MTVDHDHDRLRRRGGLLGAARRADRQPRPAGPRVAADRRRPEGREARRAPGRVLFFLSTVCAVLFVVAYFTLDIGGRPRRLPRARRVQRRPRPDPRRGPAVHRHRRHPVGAQADVRPRDRRVPPPRALLRRGPRRRPWRPCPPGSRSPASAAARWSATRCSAPCGAARRPAVIMLRDLGPTPNQVNDSGIPGAGLEHTLWTKGMRVVRDVVGTPIKASDLEIGDLINAEPAALFATDDEGEPLIEGVDLQVAKSKAAVILVRIEPDDITAGPGRDELVGRGHPLLLQDLHPRGLPDLAVRAHHPPPAVPLPPVDLRPGRRRQGRVRPGRPGAPPAADRGRLGGVSCGTERLHRTRGTELLGA